MHSSIGPVGVEDSVDPRLKQQPRSGRSHNRELLSGQFEEYEQRSVVVLACVLALVYWHLCGISANHHEPSVTGDLSAGSPHPCTSSRLVNTTSPTFTVMDDYVHGKCGP